MYPFHRIRFVCREITVEVDQRVVDKGELDA